MEDATTGISVLERTFSSQHGQGTGFVNEVLEAMQILKWSVQDMFAVELALVEAISNAIEHGNCLDPSKKVFTRCELCGDSVSISVQDEGDGFLRDAIPDPRQDDHLENPSGRGVLLIYGFMTRVWYNEKGNVLFMEKCRNRAA